MTKGKRMPHGSLWKVRLYIRLFPPSAHWSRYVVVLQLVDMENALWITSSRIATLWIQFFREAVAQVLTAEPASKIDCIIYPHIIEANDGIMTWRIILYSEYLS